MFDNISLLSLQLHKNLLVYDQNNFGSSSVVFGNLPQSSVIFRKCSEVFRKCSETFVKPSEQFWKIFRSLRKVVRNLQKIVKNGIISLRPCPILAVLGIFFIQLFPNWTACSPIRYTSQQVRLE